MKKNRLFVFGDSWAYNYFSDKDKTNLNYKLHFGSECIKKYASLHNYFGHWIDHLENFYDVYSYAYGAASNEQIIYQLGNLPDYEDGDRMIIIFTTPERFTWYYDKSITTMLPPHLTQKRFRNYNNQEIINLLENQFIERSDMWSNPKMRLNEKLFINRLSTIYSKWNPILVSWSKETSNMIDLVEHIPITKKFTTIHDETNGGCSDFHLGVGGNYELFKFFSNKLNLDIKNYKFNIKMYDFNNII